MNIYLGSPPHTWRIQRSELSVLGLIRITSTYVENTFFWFPNDSPKEDHLHIRGEYRIRVAINHLSLGSPPHTWRIQIKFADYNPRIRITSTYVENTAFLAQLSSNPKGSPPHTWRIPMWQDWDKFTARITSTYVENTR